MSDVVEPLLGILGVFALALAARLLVQNQDRIAFASVLVFIGVVVSAAGVSFEVNLAPDPILTVLLPAVIFQGTTALDVRRVWRNAG